jgi:para-nitrobenzyl esterase
MGNTHDETTGLIGAGDPTTFALTWETLPGALARHVKQFIGNLAPDAIVAEYRRLYPAYTASDVFFAATTAARSWKGFVLEAQRRAASGVAPTYVYYVNWRSPLDGGKWKAPHTIDIPLVFDNPAAYSYTAGAADAQPLADAMSAALLAFARTGNPQTPRLPDWPRFELATRPSMIFDLPSRVENDPRGAERKLFEAAVYVQPGT